MPPSQRSPNRVVFYFFSFRGRDTAAGGWEEEWRRRCFPSRDAGNGADGGSGASQPGAEADGGSELREPATKPTGGAVLRERAAKPMRRATTEDEVIR